MFSPDDFEIIDAHAHPFLDKCDGAPYGHPETLEQFVYEMKKAKVDYFA